MPKKQTNIKYTIEFVKEFALKDKTKCKSDKYINAHSKLLFECPEGHEYEMCFANFKNLGNRCPHCAGNVKYTIEFVKELSLKYNTVCKSDKYININSKLLFECINGHEYEMCFRDFKQGHRCPNCAKNKKLNIENIKSQLFLNNYKCKSDKYINANSKLVLECPNGHEIKMTWNNFQSGKRCCICANNKKYDIEYIKIYSKEFFHECISNQYINCKHKLKFKCPNSHIFECTFDNFVQGKRCPYCWYEKNKGDNHYNWNRNREEIKLNDRIRQTRSESWKRKNMTHDPNYNNWLQNPDNYELDHIIPVKLFCELCTRFDLSEEKIKKAINKKENYQLLLKNENRQKSYRGSSLFEAVNYLLNHGFLFEDFNEPSYGNLTITETDGIISLS